MATIFYSGMPCILLSVLSVSVLPTSIHGFSAKAHTKRCINLDLDRVDAICAFKNQSILLIHGLNYWTLTIEPENQTVSLPKKSNRKPITNLIRSTNGTKINDTHLQILSAVDVPVETRQNTCVEVDKQTYFYGKLNDGKVFYHQDGPYGAKFTSDNPHDFGLFRGAKSVNFNEEISAMFFYQGTVVIIQGNNMVSLKCSDGLWIEIALKELDTEFPRGEFMGRAPDSAFILPKPAGTQQEDDELIMFYGRKYVSCSVIGDDDCEGPYDIVDEFFNVDETCSLMYPYKGFNIWSTVALITVVFFIMSIVFSLLCSHFIRMKEFRAFNGVGTNNIRNNRKSTDENVTREPRPLRPERPGGDIVYYYPVNHPNHVRTNDIGNNRKSTDENVIREPRPERPERVRPKIPIGDIVYYYPVNHPNHVPPSP